MLEIIILIVLAKNIGKKVAEKGHKKFPYQLLVVALWFGGEILGGVLGAVIEIAAGEGQEPTLILDDFFGLAGAILGAVIAFAVAGRLEPVPRDEDWYPDDDYARKFRGDDAPPGRSGEEFTDRPDRPPEDRIRG